MKLLFAVLGQYFYLPNPPKDMRNSPVAISVTPAAVTRYVPDDTLTAASPDFLTPFDDGFYGMCQGAILCKWSGNGFVPATEEEQRRHGGLDQLKRGGTNSETVNGWQVHYVGPSPNYHFDVQIAGGLKIVVQNHAKDERAYQWISVDLLRPGHAPESLYNVSEAPRRVSKSEYHRIFATH